MQTTYPDTPSALTAIPNFVDKDNKLVPKGRFKAADQVRSAFMVWWNADLVSSRMRAQAQDMIDGRSPYDPGRERLLGLSGRTNVNPGIAMQSQKEAEMPYMDILESMDVLGYIPTNYGNPDDRSMWETAISEEMTRMLRNWNRFIPLWLYNAHIFVSQGLSFAYFTDDSNWQWEVEGQQKFKYPRRVRCDIESITDLCCKDFMNPADLYQYCQNKEAAIAAGWFPDEVFAAIKDTAAQQGLPSNDVEEWTKAWKENDLLYGATNIEVPVIHYWARELDGTVSHYITRHGGGGGFLYKKEGKYSAMSRFIIAYMYGIGSNGDFHSIRGHAQEIFGLGMAHARLFCKAMDMSAHAATPHLQATNEDAIATLPLTPMGPYMSVTSGVEFIETHTPDFASALAPAMNLVQQMLSSRMGQYTSNSSNGIDRTERTAYEKQMQHANEGKLSTSGINLFMISWKTHFKEIVRRIIRKGYDSSQPGGTHVQDFRARCIQRGVPAEAIDQIDVSRIEINTGIGKGSAQERQMAANKLDSMLYRADAKGQNIINRMVAAAYAGSTISNKIFPEQPGLRPPQDAVDANMENAIICCSALLGQQSGLQALPTQNHDIFIQARLQRLGEINQALEQQQIDLSQAVPQMSQLYDNASQHLEMLDPANPNRGEFKHQLQMLDEVIVNGGKHLLAEQQRQQEQQMEQQQGGGAPPAERGPNDPLDATGMTPALLVHAAKAQQELGSMQRKAQLSMSIEQQKAAQKIAIEDAKAAADIRRRSGY